MALNSQISPWLSVPSKWNSGFCSETNFSYTLPFSKLTNYWQVSVSASVSHGGSAFKIITLSVISTITILAQTTGLLYLMFHKEPPERGFKKASSLKPRDARFAFEYNTQVIHLHEISTLAKRSLVLSFSSTVTSRSLPQLCSLCVASTIMKCPSKLSLFYTSYILCLMVGSHSLNNSYSMAKAIASHCLTLV